ncbi:histidine kinase [Actinomadura vinacea]|uniref:histidine kinase n=1 Tax=Actinomadura vinacea TaxID=115336 RepID=A0ABN3J7P6_9ACTN
MRRWGWLGAAGGRWPAITDFAVPALLAAAQMGGTWLNTAGADGPLDRDRWMAGVAAIVCCNLALIWRRVAPRAVLAVTLVMSAAGTLAVHDADALVSGFAEVVALFSVAVHRGRRDAMLGCATVLVVVTLAFAPVRPGVELLTNGTLDVVTFVAVTALGQLRRQRKARHRELSERLAGAERERRDTAAAERERLARDLHDVAGHHLSSVVVHSTAASHLDDPALVHRALTAAADTARDVLKALDRLVDVVGPESGDGRLETLLPPLCRGLVRLGVPVTLSVEGPRRLRPQVTNAAYRIVQEALTNAMRYAQGAAVTVEIGYGAGGLEVVVHNAAPAEEIPAPALGGGRGIAGMRERAESLGGALDAGPDGSGGWTVRAVLPASASGGRRRVGWPEVLDGAAIGLCVALPVVLGFTPGAELLADWPLGAGALAVAALVGRALPLWWRRRAPYTTLVALALIDTSWAVLAGWTGSTTMLLMLLFGCPTAMIAVSSVGGYARRTKATWPAPLLAAVPWGVASGVLGALTDPSAGDPDAVAFGVVASVSSVLLLLPFWAWGRAVAGRGVRWEADALEAMAARAGEVVFAERHRVAMGLRGTVLEHIARVVHTADAGLASAETDMRKAQEALAAVAEHARAALTDMRALLDTMQDETA